MNETDLWRCDGKVRCPKNFMGRFISKRVLDYHDLIWCKPCFDDRELFAMLVLEIMQAGLSWGMVLEKEFAIREAFDFFDVDLVSRYGNKKIESMLNNANLVRNSRKIKAAINNARAFLEVQQRFCGFSNYIWSFTSGKVIDHRLTDLCDMLSENELSRKISSDLKGRGFVFVGPVIIYSYLQAIGVFNDHHVNCEFR